MTFERDPVIATLAARASDQVRSGIAALHAGEMLRAEVLLRAAQATLASLTALLDGTVPARPMRRLALVGGELPEWMNRKANSEDPDAA